MLVLLSGAALLSVIPARSEPKNLAFNPSFESLDAQNRPIGWRLLYSAGDRSIFEGTTPPVLCVTGGKAGETTHTGSAALQFSFPKDTKLPERCTWSFDPVLSGIDLQPGLYEASVWVKTTQGSEKLVMELWDANVPVERYATGDQAIDQRVTEPGEIQKGKWVKLQLPFGIPASGSKVRLAVSFHVSELSHDSQLFVDDLEVVKKK
jgi:hypothetical protein